MKAIFETENVRYEVSMNGYTRNDHFVQGEVTLKSLSIGQPAVIEVKNNQLVQVIRTDVVIDIEECPAYFKMLMGNEVHPYNIKVTKGNGKVINTMRIGTVNEIRQFILSKFPSEKVNYEIAPIPSRIRGVS